MDATKVAIKLLDEHRATSAAFDALLAACEEFLEARFRGDSVDRNPRFRWEAHVKFKADVSAARAARGK